MPQWNKDAAKVFKDVTKVHFCYIIVTLKCYKGVTWYNKEELLRNSLGFAQSNTSIEQD